MRRNLRRNEKGKSKEGEINGEKRKKNNWPKHDRKMDF